MRNTGRIGRWRFKDFLATYTQAFQMGEEAEPSKVTFERKAKGG